MPAHFVPTAREEIDQADLPIYLHAADNDVIEYANKLKIFFPKAIAEQIAIDHFGEVYGL